jgi:acyl-coenzyme A thioesterase PaaI-like protein
MTESDEQPRSRTLAAHEEKLFGVDSTDPRLGRLTLLGNATRGLMEAVVETAVDLDVVDDVAREIEKLTARLRATKRPPTMSMDPEAIRNRFVAYNPVIGLVNPFAVPLVVDIDKDGRASARVTLTRVHEGPPNAVHGGIVALLIDQLLGHAVGTIGRPGMTASLTVRFRKPTPYGTELLVEAWHVKSEGRRVVAEARITADDVVVAEAEALFVVLTDDQRKRYLRGDDRSPMA